MNHFYSNLKLMLVALFACVGIGAWADEVTDVLNQSVTGVSGTTYKDFSDKSVTSDAVYAGQCAGGNESIQLRSNNNNSGVITTASGGTVKKVVVVWNASTADARELNIYGSNTAYSAATDLYAEETQGKLIGTLKCEDATEGVSTLVVSDDYAYIGFRSNSGAMYLTSVSITWETGSAAPTVAKPVITPNSGSFLTQQEVTVTCATEGAKIYYTLDGTDPTDESSPYSESLTITETTTVKAIAVLEDISSSVAEATYTKLNAIANTAETAYTVADAKSLIDDPLSALSQVVFVRGIISQIDSYKNGNIIYWISDDGTTTNQFECYKGKGIDGADFESAEDLQVGATVIVKGILTKFNTTYELKEGNELVSYKAPAAPTVATPVISPNGGTFQGVQLVTLSCETEGATMYYTLDGSDPAEKRMEYQPSGFRVQNTCTVKAIAVKGENVSAVATATFTKVESYETIAALNALADKTPFNFTGDAFVVAVAEKTLKNGTAKYVYIHDNSGNSLIYDASSANTAAVEAGRFINPNWSGKVSIYNQLFELVPDQPLTVGVSKYPVSYPDLSEREINGVVSLKNIESCAVNGSKITINIKDADKSFEESYGLAGYNQFGLEIPAFEEGKTYEIIGAIGQFNDQLQFWPISIQEETEPTPEPELSFYVTGTMANWGIDANYKMTLNEELVEKGIKELSLTMNLNADDEIKVASSNDGVNVKELFPTGEGNAYVIPSDGEYTVYCRPNFDGDKTWIEKCLKVVPTAAPSSIQNADFSNSTPLEGDLFGYGKDAGGGAYGLQDVDGWSKVVVSGDNGNADFPNSGMGGAVFAYGSTNLMRGNKKSAPAAGPDGEAGNALGFFAVWGCGGYYYQNITLAAGTYTLLVPMYNQSGTQANESYTGFFVKDSDVKYTVAVNPTVGAWTVQSVTFTLEEETEGEIRLGYKSNGSGSGDNPMLFIDGVQLMSELDGAKAQYNTALAAAQAAAADEVVTGSEKETLNQAIAANSNIDMTSVEALKTAATALNEAVATFNAAKEYYQDLADLKEEIIMVNYNDRFPYASEAKKNAAIASMRGNATSADDAKAMAEAIRNAYRSFADSHALAEGVEGAVNMTDKIVNPNAESAIAEPWTLVNGEGSSGSLTVKGANQEPPTDGEGNTYAYFDGGNWDANAWNVALQQNITLPAGKYLLTVAGRASTDVAMTVFAGEIDGGIPAMGAAGGLFGRGWNNSDIEFEMTEEGEITIGVKGVTEVVHNWMSFTRFRLVQLEASYTVTISDAIENGTVEATPAEAAAGETVSLTAKPAEGYELKSFMVTCKTTDEVVMVAEDGTFIMPADDVTVNATFRDLASIVYIETDLTSQFAALTKVSNWISGTSSNCGVVADQFGPKVTVNGQKVQLIENYVEGQAKKQATGDVMYQTVTGLAAGTYSIELYGAANLTAGRSDMTTDFADGDEASQKAVYLYAMTADGSTVKKYIPCLIEDNFNNRGGEEAVPTAKLEGIVVGEDGKVKIGIYKEVGLTNWHFVQLKSVIATVDADYALAPHVAAVRAIEESTVPPALYTQIEEALINYDNRFDTAQDYLDAIEALDAIAAKAKAYAPIAELLAKGEEYKAHVAEGNEAIATYEAAVAVVKAAFTDVAIPDFAAAQATVAAALPALGKAQTKAGADMTLFADNLAWTCPQGNGPGNYQGCTETYTEGSYTTGKVMYQKVEGLPAGFYKVEFIAVANHARGASAFGDNIAQVYANDATEDITVEDQAACTPANYVRTLTTFVKDGVLEYGLQNIADGGNWYVAKLNAITLVEPTNPAPTNLDFAETEAIDNGVCTYAKDMATNSTTYFGAQAVDGWTALNPSDNVAPEAADGSRGELDQRAAAVVAYGSTAWLGGSANVAPAAGPEGSNGKGLGMVAVWTATVQYTQPVTLDAGTYTLEIPVYNSVGGTKVPAKSLIGFIASDGTEYLAPAKAYAVNTWTTETVTFTLDKTTNGVFSLGYTMTNNGNGDAPHLFFDCINIITDQREALRTELKAALSVAQATIEAKANVGDKLFQKPEAAFEVFNRSVIAQQAVAENEEATVEQLQTAIATLADASAAYDAALNTPEAEKLYTFELSLGGEEPLYMNLAEGGITIAAEATPLKFIATENAGQYYLANEDETLFVGLAGGNAWTMSTAADKKAAWTFTVLGDGAYRINNLVTVGRFVGTNSSDKSAGNPCYADKQTSNGNVDWLIAEYVLPAVVLNAPTWSAAEGTQAEPTVLAADETLKITYTADNLEENGYNAEDLKVKVTVMVSGDLPENVMNMQSETKHSVRGDFYINLGEVDFPVELKAGYVYQNIAVFAAQLVKQGETAEEDEIIASYAGAPAQLHWIEKEAAPAQTYAINITPAENGTVKVDKETAAEGETVTVTVTPAEGYMVDEAYWTFVDGAGTPQKNEFREPEAGNSSSFTMPAADVTITITFKEAGPASVEYVGIIEQTTSHPQMGVVGESTTDATVTVTPAEDGTVSVTFPAFEMPMPGGATRPMASFTIENVKATVVEADGSVVYASEEVRVDLSIGGMPAYYNAILTGAKANANATPVFCVTLTQAMTDTMYFGADQDAIDAYKKTTGINDVKGVKNVGAIYDLSGRKVEKMVKGGIYIVNGKKVSFK